MRHFLKILEIKTITKVGIYKDTSLETIRNKKTLSHHFASFNWNFNCLELYRKTSTIFLNTDFYICCWLWNRPFKGELYEYIHIYIYLCPKHTFQIIFSFVKILVLLILKNYKIIKCLILIKINYTKDILNSFFTIIDNFN